MQKNSKFQVEYYILILWSIYTVYLAIFGSLLFFPQDGYELLLTAFLQVVVVITSSKLFKAKYSTTIKLSSIVNCLLVIFWHFSLYHIISRKWVISLFAVAPLLLTIISYYVGKIKKNYQMSIIKIFGVVSLITFLNFLIPVFTFYIFHYWI